MVDLGRHGAVVAALHPGIVEDGSISVENLALIAYGMRGNDAYQKMADQKGKRVANKMPMLIWFSDVTDRTTARMTNIYAMQELFGPSARFIEASVEITSDPVVIDLDKKLLWYNALAESQKQGITSMPNVFQLVYNMFIAGD